MLQVFREDGLLSASPNFGLDWFEGAIAKPDLVLADFYSAFHPSAPVRLPPEPCSSHSSQARSLPGLEARIEGAAVNDCCRPGLGGSEVAM